MSVESPFSGLDEGIQHPQATRTNINAALARHPDLTIQDLRDFLAIEGPEKNRLQRLQAILGETVVMDMADKDLITFGMIKPHREEAILESGDDEKIAAQVVGEIKSPLYVAAQQAIWIPTTYARAFYAHLPENVVDRVAGFMSSGASTALVLGHPGGSAVQEWRSQMGATRAHEMPDQKNTLRYRFQTSRGVGNNVTHGSDSTDNVKKELRFMREMLGVLIGED